MRAQEAAPAYGVRFEIAAGSRQQLLEGMSLFLQPQLNYYRI